MTEDACACAGCTCGVEGDAAVVHNGARYCSEACAQGHPDGAPCCGATCGCACNAS